MLEQYLQGAITDLQQLIDITHQDIADIQIANNEAIFSRNESKNSLIKSFEQKKILIEEEMQQLMDKNPQDKLQDLLPPEVDKGLDTLRKVLVELKKLNSAYAQSVFAVSEFYSSLLTRLIPHEENGYGVSQASVRLLQTQA
ncbi:MAG: hypothetical protein PUJ79_07475 [Helicobacter sp.]|uniref:hypothetical protein n=1 Tax=Helicobacter sp. 10-6591 TaxID=2004998 RepID=UPI000DCEEA94|nr:hypothetical protein [Helicobacter sp. 10-6591]MCI7484943.1 hypothetical protein [Helicobacter sp.]MDD7568226.1 hypothetical protein [Helicobacter sp.]MDY5740272.1 hypothetical protein [Helicobacter sp.]RAX56131.1 hypothetical protein CCY97_00965 [Helicobacter sp. 10-6591]